MPDATHDSFEEACQFAVEHGFEVVFQSPEYAEGSFVRFSYNYTTIHDDEADELRIWVHAGSIYHSRCCDLAAVCRVFEEPGNVNW